MNTAELLNAAMADLELRNATKMRAGQEAYDNAAPADAPSYSVQEFQASSGDMEEAIGRADRVLHSDSLEAAIAVLLDAAKTLVSELEGMQS